MDETSLIDAAVAWMRERLPTPWTVEASVRQGSTTGEGQLVENVIQLRAPDGTYTLLAVEARPSFAPRDVDRLLPGLARSLRALAGGVPLLVVAPWLSARSQQLLSDQGINFLDLTGNGLLRLDRPALFVQSVGAARNPQPAARGAAGLRGPKAARLIRQLADVRPPYSGRELALAAGLTPGYVSRLLDSLDREAIVKRGSRGRVTETDVPALLRAWAESYGVFKSNAATPMLALNGAADAFRKLGGIAGKTLVSGSFAAVRWAPVTAPALLLLYCEDAAATAEQLGLLPAEEGANVVLLRAFDEVAWERASEDRGVSYCAPSQVVVDCLTGNGRMPAEGEALLSWMADNESQWRAPSLPQDSTELDAA